MTIARTQKEEKKTFFYKLFQITKQDLINNLDNLETEQ